MGNIDFYIEFVLLSIISVLWLGFFVAIGWSTLQGLHSLVVKNLRPFSSDESIETFF